MDILHLEFLKSKETGPYIELDVAIITTSQPEDGKRTSTAVWRYLDLLWEKQRSMLYVYGSGTHHPLICCSEFAGLDSKSADVKVRLEKLLRSHYLD